MAKKNILNGVSSTDLVNNLNANLLNGYYINDIIPTVLIGGGLSNISDSPNERYSGYIVGTTILETTYQSSFYVEIVGKTPDLIDAKVVYSLGRIYYVEGPSFNGNITHFGQSLGDFHLFVDKNNKICFYFKDTVVGHANTFYIKVYDTNTNNSPRKYRNVLESIKRIDDKSFLEEISKDKILPPIICVKSNTGNTFDHIDLPATVKSLDISTLPPISNVGTIILRYNGVVQDLDTYVSQVEEPIMPLPMNDEVEVSAETPSTLELNSGIAPMVNLDEYVGTPNNWLKIYVPESQIYNYRLEYPTLKDYLLPITGYTGKEIGSRNLLLDSHVTTSGTYSLNSNLYYRFSENNFLEDGEVFTLTAKVKLGEGKTHLVAMNSDGDGNYQFGMLKHLGNDLYRLTGKYKQKPESKFMTFWAMPHEVGTTSYVYWAKLERGTVATDWTPAPEDIENDLKETIETEKEYTEETYAKKDGAYEGLLAGTALNLQGQHNIINNSMYRPTAGTLDINWEAAEIEGIQGNSVAWNQLIKNGNFADGTNNWNTYQNSNVTVQDNYCKIEIGTDANSGFALGYDIECLKNHKYILSFEAQASEPLTNVRIITSSYLGIDGGRTIKDRWTRYLINCIVSKEEDDHHIVFCNGSFFEKEFYLRNVQLFDLTLIYGAGNEPETTEQFEDDYQRWFGKYLEYEEYDEGSLRNVQATGIKTVGFNLSSLTQWDDWMWEWDNIILFKNDCGYKGQFYISGRIIENNTQNTIWGRIFYTDGTFEYVTSGSKPIGEINQLSNKNKIVESIKTGHSIASNFKLEDLCINFVWSGNRNGKYEEPWEETRSLPLTSLTGKLNDEGESVIIFPDGMKRARDTYDEIKVENGITKAIKRVGSVDLKSLEWLKKLDDEIYKYRFITKNPIAKSGVINQSIGNILCNIYVTRAAFQTYGDNRKNGISVDNLGCLQIYDKDYEESEVDAFMSAIQEGIAYYELAEPEVYIIDEFQLPLTYRVDDYGTEQVISPEGTVNPYLVTRYGVNAVDTIRRLPQNYVSVKSLDDLLIKIGSYMQGTWTKSWNDITNSYDFSFVPNEVPDSSQPNEELPEI